MVEGTLKTLFTTIEMNETTIDIAEQSIVNNELTIV